MTNDVHSPAEPSVTALVSGILNDAQELLKQQFALIRHEIQSDLRKTRDAMVSLAVGAGTCAVGGILLCLMLVYLLHWAASPAGSDPAAIPLWGCFGIVGGVFALVGGLLVYAGVKKFQSFNPLPDESAAALKENMQWLTNRK